MAAKFSIALALLACVESGVPCAADELTAVPRIVDADTVEAGLSKSGYPASTRLKVISAVSMLAVRFGAAVLKQRPNYKRIVAIAPGYANFRGSTVMGAVLALARSTAKMWADGLSVTVGLWPSGIIRPPMSRTRTMRGNIRSGCGPARSLRPGTGVIVARKPSYSAPTRCRPRHSATCFLRTLPAHLRALIA